MIYKVICMAKHAYMYEKNYKKGLYTKNITLWRDKDICTHLQQEETLP